MTAVPFPQGSPTPHPVVMLQDDPNNPAEDRVSVVVCQTDKKPGKPTKAWQVRVGAAEGFDHDTIVDGRWVFCLKRSTVVAGTFITTLDAIAMRKVDTAVVAGLQLGSGSASATVQVPAPPTP